MAEKFYIQIAALAIFSIQLTAGKIKVANNAGDLSPSITDD